MANENLPEEKQKELMEGGIVGDVDKFVDWIASLIEENGLNPENAGDIGKFMSNVNPHIGAIFGFANGSATTHPAPENQNPFTQIGNIGAPMHEATGDYTKGGEFRMNTSPADNAGPAPVSRQVGNDVITSSPSSMFPKVEEGKTLPKKEGGEKKGGGENFKAATSFPPTDGKKEEAKSSAGKTPPKKEEGGVKSSSGQGEDQEVEALRGLANMVLGGGSGPPQPGVPGGASAPTLGTAVGGVATPQQQINPLGNFRRY